MDYHMQKAPQQLAYEYIREGIVSGRLAACTRLKSEAVAQSLGISRMPVREALRQLHAEGLVTVRPNRGAVVTSLTAGDVMELFEIRSVLEGLAIRHAANYATSEDYRSLSEHLKELSRNKSDYLRWVELHETLHDRLCRLSRRERLSNQVYLIRQQILPYTRLYAGRSSDPEIVGYEHMSILDSMRAGDPQEIEVVVRTHIMMNATGIVEELAKILPNAGAAAPHIGVCGAA